MRFCSHCGKPVIVEVPPGDNLPRHICRSCNTIHYQNPKIVAGCIPEWEGLILLCKRAIEPRSGYWTLPAGFMENGETIEEAAARETLEEAEAQVQIGSLFAAVSVKHVNQVHIMFRATLLSDEYSAGAESLEVELFSEQDIPWDQIAFPSVDFTLRRFIADRRRGEFGIHQTEINRKLRK